MDNIVHATDGFCAEVARIVRWLNLSAHAPVTFAEPGFRQDLFTTPQPFIELYLVTEGQVRISVRDESRVLRPGSMALANAHFGNVGRDVAGPFRYGCVSLEVPDRPEFADWAKRPLLMERQAPDRVRIQQLFKEVANLYHGPQHTYRDVLLKAALLQLFACVGDEGTGAFGSNGAQNPHVRHAIDFMVERKGDAQLALPQISRHVGVSPSHLVRMFRANLGLSPMRYLTQLRIRQAQSLLHRSQLAIKEVSFLVGFHDQLYFSRVFRQETGASPSAYRQGLDPVPPSHWALPRPPGRRV